MYICIYIYTYIYIYIYTIESNQKLTHKYLYNTLCICIQLYTVRIERKRRPPALSKR